MEPSKLPEHCPEPPGNQSEFRNGSTDNDLSEELRHKEEELQHLRSEIQGYVGKLKGYQTLGQLYAESQKECNSYKQQNDELARKLGNLMRRLSPTDGTTVPEAYRLQTLPASGHSAAETEVTENRVENGTGSRTRDESQTNIELESLGSLGTTGSFGYMQNRENNAAAGGDKQLPTLLDFKEGNGHRGTAYVAHSDTSSPSFVRISSSVESSPTSLLSDNLNAPQKQQVHGDKDASRHGSMADPSNVSVSVQQLTEQLKTLGQQGGSSYQDVSSNLIRTSLSVLKLEKQTRVQKAMMEQMASKCKELQAELDAKNQTITLLQEEYARLTAELKKPEDIRKAQIKYLETATDPDEFVAGKQISGEWVEVEKNVSAGNTAAESVTTVSMTEIELKRRVDKLNSMITELVSVNRSWDQHCKQLEATHAQQLAAVQNELMDVRQRLNDRERCDEQRQQEFDDLLLNAKKQREAEEMAKDDALTQLHLEKRLHADAEEKCVEFSRKMAELESRLRTIQNTKHADMLRLSQPSSLSLTASAGGDRDMMMELQILQEQVTVFKEDFDQERRDREASSAAAERLEAKLAETNTELSLTKKKLMDALAHHRATKHENVTLKDRLQKVVDDLKTLQRQAVRPPQQPPIPYYQTAPTPVYPVHQPMLVNPYGGRTWACDTCTYVNPAQRSFCEMCGRMKDNETYPRREAGVLYHNGVARPAAALHGYQPAAAACGSRWPPLADSNLETDQ